MIPCYSVWGWLSPPRIKSNAETSYCQRVWLRSHCGSTLGSESSPPTHMQAVEGDPHAVFGLHLVPVVGLHQLTGAPWLNGEVEMTADVPAPSPAHRYHSAGRFPSGRYRGGHRRQRLLPAGEAGAAPPVGVVLAAPDPASSPRLLIRHTEVQPDRGSGGGFPPFAVHRQPQVPSTVKCMPAADNHYLRRAGSASGSRRGFHLPSAAHRTGRSAPQDRTGRRFSSAPPERWGRYGYFADPDVVVERRANKLVTQGSQQLLLTANRPAAQQTRPAIDGPALRTARICQTSSLTIRSGAPAETVGAGSAEAGRGNCCRDAVLRLTSGRSGLGHLQRQPPRGRFRQDQAIEQRYLVAALRGSAVVRSP